MKKGGFSALCCLAVLASLTAARSAAAQINVSGLEDQTSLSIYIQETVLKKYKDKSDNISNISTVKGEIEKALKAKGYYDSKVTYKTDEGITFRIRTGDIYTIDTVTIDGINDFTDANVTSLKKADTLDASIILTAQSNLLKHISTERCFYNLSVKNEVVLKRDAKTSVVRFVVDGQPDAKFGSTEFSGADNIKRTYLDRLLKHKDGECWSTAKLEATKAALLGSGLLSSAKVDLPETLPNDKTVPLVFELKETAARNVRLGTNYSTSEGPGVSAGWTHKNYLGAGEKLGLTTQLSTLLQSVEVDFEKPFFMSDKQSLNISSKVQRKDTDGFEELTADVEASIKRKLAPHWTGNLGVGLEISQITDEDGVEDTEDTFALVSLPGGLNFDNRDSPLDPHKGYSLALGAEPFVDAFGESDPFFKARATGTTYFDLSDSTYDPVLALRGSVGGIIGSGTGSIPATKRFYSGGGGTIRGFGFQEAGPIDDDGDPTGGRSVVEGAVELRMKFTETLGGVAFVDAGGVYDSVVPDFQDGIFVGAGVGARYYTSFGPLRFDVATPLNKRDETDQKVQIYISIGQAF